MSEPTLKDAVAWVQQRLDSFYEQHATTDPDTGAVEFGRGSHAEAKADYAAELQEIIEGLSGLSASPAPAPSEAPVDQSLILAAARTREDLGATGTNYPDVRRLLEFAERVIKRSATPTPAPVGLTDEQRMGAAEELAQDRFRPERGSFWWHVRIGTGQQTVGKCHSETAALQLAAALRGAFLDGAFVAAHGIAAPRAEGGE